MYSIYFSRQVSSKKCLYPKKKKKKNFRITYTSQLFNMATPEKFENQNERFLKFLYFRYKRLSLENVYRKNYVLSFKLFPCLSGGFL